MTNKLIKIFAVICAVIAILAMSLMIPIGVHIYQSEYKSNFIDSSTSPDEHYTLALYQIGEPFIVGSAKGRILLKSKGKIISKKDIEVANDGGSIRNDNWQVSWHDDCAEVLIDSEEHPPLIYILRFDGAVIEVPEKNNLTI